MRWAIGFTETEYYLSGGDILRLSIANELLGFSISPFLLGGDTRTKESVGRTEDGLSETILRIRRLVFFFWKGFDAGKEHTKF